QSTNRSRFRRSLATHPSGTHMRYALTLASSLALVGCNGADSSGDSSDSPKHHGGDCKHLAAVDRWEDVTPTGVDLNPDKSMGALTVSADPNNPGTLYLGTDKQGLWKSTTCGAHWTKINTGKTGQVLDSGSLWTAVVDPQAPTALYGAALYGSDPSLQ